MMKMGNFEHILYSERGYARFPGKEKTQLYRQIAKLAKACLEAQRWMFDNFLTLPVKWLLLREAQWGLVCNLPGR